MEEETYRTLRDEIAIAAMACILQVKTYKSKRLLALDAYQLADAMMEARQSNSTESPTRT
jgi:hypothetical protein